MTKRCPVCDAPVVVTSDGSKSSHYVRIGLRVSHMGDFQPGCANTLQSIWAREAMSAAAELNES